MAVPRKKISKHSRKTRHATWQKINLKQLKDRYQRGKCSNCGATKLSHRVCPDCGYYRGKQVVTIKTQAKTDVVDA